MLPDSIYGYARSKGLGIDQPAGWFRASGCSPRGVMAGRMDSVRLNPRSFAENRRECNMGLGGFGFQPASEPWFPKVVPSRMLDFCVQRDKRVDGSMELNNSSCCCAVRKEILRIVTTGGWQKIGRNDGVVAEIRRRQSYVPCRRFVENNQSSRRNPTPCFVSRPPSGQQSGSIAHPVFRSLSIAAVIGQSLAEKSAVGF